MNPQIYHSNKEIEMDYISEKEFIENQNLKEIVKKEGPLKNLLVEYVGEQQKPDDKNVTVEMIVETMAKEFPEFVLVVAEENWVRGYQQALDDVEVGRKIAIAQLGEKNENKDAKQKSYKLCEKEE